MSPVTSLLTPHLATFALSLEAKWGSEKMRTLERTNKLLKHLEQSIWDWLCMAVLAGKENSWSIYISFDILKT